MNYFTKLGNKDITYKQVSESGIGNIVAKFSSYSQYMTYHTIFDTSWIYDMWPELTTCKPDSVRYVKIASIDEGILLPHKDHAGLKCCLNWYIYGNDSVTTFYTANPGAIPMTAPGERESNIYRLSDVTKVDDFVAQPGDMYFLNVSEIHSVLSKQKGIRQFVTLAWYHKTYQEVLPSLTTIFTE